jgi:hypothetical protein
MQQGCPVLWRGKTWYLNPSAVNLVKGRMLAVYSEPRCGVSNKKVIRSQFCAAKLEDLTLP